MSNASDGGFVPGTKAVTSLTSEFVKFDRVGVAVVGRVVRFGENESGAFCALSPVVRRDADGKMGLAVMEMNVGISAGLRNLLTGGMLGKWIVLRYSDDDKEKGRNGSALKVFERWVIDEAAARQRIADDKLVDYAIANNPPEQGSYPGFAPRPRKSDANDLPI